MSTSTTPQKSHYNYDPSFEAAVIFAVLYTIVFIASVFLWVKYRAWVWIVMVVAGGMESAGYIVRSLSTKNVDNKNLYVLQFCLIVLAPVLMAAACYVLFGRIVYHVVPSVSRTTKLLWIPPRFITPIFVVCDIIALLLQLYGAVKITSVTATTVNPVSVLSKGKEIAEIGVAVQLVCFGLFAIIAVRFNFTSKRFNDDFLRRIATANGQESGVEMTTIGEGRKGDKYCRIDGGERLLRRNWVALLMVTNWATLLILIRSIYRMVDFALGRTGYTETHEWCTYILDALPIFPCVAMFVYWHPAKYLPYLQFRLPKQGRR